MRSDDTGEPRASDDRRLGRRTVLELLGTGATVSTLGLGATSTATASSIDDWRVGFNEQFAYQWLLEQGEDCPHCPTNAVPRSLSVIRDILEDLAGNRHVGSYREIIPVTALEPHEGDTSNYETLTDVIEIFQGFNLKLVLTPGLPVPDWMLVAGNNLCPMPNDSDDYSTFKNRLAWTVGEFVRHLWNSPRIDQEWMQTNLYIEGFNEFDAVEAAGCDGTHLSSPKRAAALQNGIQWVLNYYDLPVSTLSPSVVGVYSGYDDVDSIEELYAQYFEDYYKTYSGGGRPSVHMYPDTGSVSGTLDRVASILDAIDQRLPSAHRGQIYLTEVGAADVYDECTNSSPGAQFSISEREDYYPGIMERDDIAEHVSMLLYWRLMNLPAETTANPCEQYMGVMHADASDYKGVGFSVFDVLGGSTDPY